MKSVLFGLYIRFLKLCAFFVPIRSNSFVILNGAGRSGSNGYLFYKYLRKEHPELNVTLVEPWPSSHLKWSVWKKIGGAQYIFTTHQPFKIKRKQISFSLWHGIPLKRMGFMAYNTKYHTNKHNMNIWQHQADYIASSSDIYETLMASCVGIDTNKFIRTGFPRLDFLNKPISKRIILKDLFDSDNEKAKIGIYMPTFRYELEDRTIMNQIESGNFFAFDDFNIVALNSTLVENNQYLIVKLHPYEMKLVSAEMKQASNIAFLNNNYLNENDIDLYELLGITDFLMTDFSSMFFDYLLLNRPIIFVSNFLKQYSKARGLLMSPYEKIVPGQQVLNQKELQIILKNIDKDPYKERRNKLCTIFFEKDKNCCQSIYELTKRVN